jgi:ABC-type multidrug transport system fused ATPase/permease subunit
MTLPLRKYWDLLARHILPQRGRFVLLSLLLLGSIALQVGNPQIMRSFIDTALKGGALQQLMLAAGVFIGIALLNQGISILVAYLGENVAWTATNALRAELAWHCLNLDMDFHNDHTPGELIERIDGDVTEMATFFSQFVVMTIGNLLLMAGILFALFREDWRAGLAFTLFSIVALYWLNRVRDLALPDQKARRQAEADLFGFVEEQLNGTEDVRSSGAVDFSLRELFRLQGHIMRHDRKAHKKSWIIDTLMGGLMAVGTVLALASGYYLFKAGLVTVGTVYLFIYYMTLLETPINALTREVGAFQTIGACVERLSELLKLHPRVQDVATADGHLPDGALELDFEGVSFAYQASEPVLRGLSFSLKPGSVLGLLGRTGSGKTTLTRLIFRLYDPSGGRIILGGKDLRDTSLQLLRKRIGVVTQEVQLFRASVRDNLTFFDRSIPDEQILTALQELELGDWLRSLPHGLDTRLETGSRSLSAGEAQLLAFARIFLRSPGLVILDEASSRLDPATEQRIERAIDRLLSGRTAIVVAHRLGSVQRSGEILILDEGEVCEYGPREQLAGDPGSRFHQLLQTGLEEVLV